MSSAASSENESLVLTVMGKDRPGLVELIARTVQQYEGNWVESRMARLGGFFAGILAVEIPRTRVEVLQKALSALEQSGLRIIIERTDVDARERSDVSLELVGADRRGIVRQLTEVLASLGVNVEELETSLQRAPLTGEPLFRATASLHVPETLELDRLRAALEAIAADLMVDLRLQRSERLKTGKR